MITRPPGGTPRDDQLSRGTGHATGLERWVVAVNPDDIELARGSHAPDTGLACVMEYVSILAGEPWSDNPDCTHDTLARLARFANDYLSDADREELLRPLAWRLVAAGESSPALDCALERLGKAIDVRLADAQIPHSAVGHTWLQALLAGLALYDEHTHRGTPSGAGVVG